MKKGSRIKPVYGFSDLLNHSNSTPEPPAFRLFSAPPPPVIDDMPAWDLPEDRVQIVRFAEGEPCAAGISLVHTQNGTPIGLWKDPNGYRNAMFPTPVRDFSGYSHLEFMLYSENASGAVFTFELRGLWQGNVDEPPHFRRVIRLNWHGWRTFSLDLSALDPAWGGTLTDIRFVGFHATGWSNDIYAVPGSYIYLSDVWLTRRKSNYNPDLSALTPDVLETIRARWEATLVGTAELTAAYPAARASSETFGHHGSGIFSRMQDPAPDAPFLWEDATDMNRGEQVQIVAERLFYMARAWSAVGSHRYHDPVLLDAIRRGLDWLWQNGYGDCRLERGCPGNWWQWTVGIPLALTKCLLLIRHELTAEELTHYLSFADKRDPLPRMTNANRSWISYVCILSSLLQNDLPRLVESLRCMQTVFCYTTCSDGFYRDGSFIMHDNKAYIGGYGSNYLNEIVDFFYAFAGTPLAIPDEYRTMTFDQLFASFVPFIYKGIMQKAVSGRGTRGNGLAVGVARSALKLVPVATEEEKQRLYGFVRFCCDSNPQFAAELDRQMPPVAMPYHAELMAAPPYAPPHFTRVYGGMDRAVTQTPDYCASLAFVSSRTAHYESINGDNKRSWYQADGSLCITTDDLMQYDGDWYRESDPYRFPGTTVTSEPRCDDCVVFLPNGAYAFCGGVDDGRLGLVGGHFSSEAFNFPWPFGFESDLDYKKAWYLFDGGVLCLGAGINCTDAYSVYTTVDNRRYHPTRENVLTVDGVPTLPGGRERTIPQVQVLTHSAFGAYVFPQKTDVRVRRRKGNHSYYEILIPHGKKPKDASFAYYMLPWADEAKAQEFLKNPPVTILQHTTSLMAIEDNAAHLRGYVFFEAGSFDGITVSEPCVLTLRHTEEGDVCCVSDPTHMLRSLTVTFADTRRLVRADDGIEAADAAGNTAVTVDTNGKLGITRRFTLA